MHRQALLVYKNGLACRFCQQCTKLHRIEHFDGVKRGCRRRLQQRKLRRRELSNFRRNHSPEVHSQVMDGKQIGRNSSNEASSEISSTPQDYCEGVTGKSNSHKLGAPFPDLLLLQSVNEWEAAFLASSCCHICLSGQPCNMCPRGS
uniref:SBP-type domain-containing protein n=2 Tax=Tetraselmis sp. GSL018 TaxID=582737 RepID=A0A061QM26_9CHLO